MTRMNDLDEPYDGDVEEDVVKKVMIRTLTANEAQGMSDMRGPLYGVCDETGACLAVSNMREVAYAFARNNNMLPESVH